jgi:MFS family permease
MPAPWVVGGGLLSFGLVVGFTITALPFLLTHAGVPLYKVAGVSAIVMSPTFWAFLLQPIMDTGLTRRAYCWLTAVIAAIGLGAGLILLSPGNLAVTTVLLTLAELAMVLYSGAISGWTAEFTPDERRGIVSGWTNVFNLGGGAVGSLAIMSLARRVPRPELAAGMAVVIVLGVLPTAWFPAPGRSAFRFRQIFTQAMQAIWRAAKTPECLTGFAIFLAPASAEAAINLFSGMGPDFHTAATTVIWVTGAGCAVTASLGALVGGHLADRLPRGILYVSAGMITAVMTLAMAFAPRVPAVFIAGALFYNGMAGVVYAAFNAVGYQIVGRKTAVASTQLGLFSASTNFAIVYMTWADGQGFKHFGTRGLLLTDGLASLLAGALLLVFLGRRLARRPGAEAEPMPAQAGAGREA